MESISGSTYAEVDIIQLLLSKSIQGFELFYNKYAAVLYGIIVKKVSDPQQAHMVLEQIIVDIWHSIQDFDPKKQRFFTWLYQKVQQNSTFFLVQTA